MTYIRNSTVVAEMLKKNHDCNKLKDDFEQIIHNVRNKEDVEIVRKHILLMFDELLMNEVKEKIDDMERDDSSKKVGWILLSSVQSSLAYQDKIQDTENEEIFN